MRSLTLGLLMTLVFSSGLNCGASDHASADRTVSPFKLDDQYQHPHQVRFPSAKVMVIIVADRKGSTDIDSWVRPLVERFGDRIRIVGIADLSKVPAVLRSFVRKRFAQEQSYPVMLDWEGHITKDFAYRAGRANVFVVGPRGRIAWHGWGVASPEKLMVLSSAIENAMLLAKPAP